MFAVNVVKDVCTASPPKTVNLRFLPVQSRGLSSRNFDSELVRKIIFASFRTVREGSRKDIT